MPEQNELHDSQIYESQNFGWGETWETSSLEASSLIRREVYIKNETDIALAVLAEEQETNPSALIRRYIVEGVERERKHSE